MSKALGIDWIKAKLMLDAYSMDEAEVETSDLVWGRILLDNDFEMETLFCQNGCDLNGFCREHPKGVYVVKLPNHVVCVSDGCFYDSWDSGREIPIYCWKRR